MSSAPKTDWRRPLHVSWLLGYMAQLTPCPLVAMIGNGSGLELFRMAQGVAQTEGADYAGPSLYWFGGGPMPKGMWGAFRYNTQGGLRVFAPASVSQVMHYRPIKSVVRFVVARDGSRRKWHEAVEWIIAHDPRRFSLIVHTGRGTVEDIQGDLEVLLPACDDATCVVVCKVKKGGPAALMRRVMKRYGWSTVVLGNLAIMQCPPVAIPIEENAHAGYYNADAAADAVLAQAV